VSFRLIESLPLVGDLWAFLDDRLAFMAACARAGDARWVRLGPKRVLVLSHPEHIRELFLLEGKHFVRGVTGAPMRQLMGEGLLLSEGDVWKRQRRDVQPLFGPSHIAEWQPQIEGAAAALMSRWSDGDVRDVHHEMHRLTLDIAARLFLGFASDDRGALHPALEGLLVNDIFRAPLPIGPLRRFVRSTPPSVALAFDRLIDEAMAGATAPDAPGVLAGLARAAGSRRELRDQLVTLLFTAQDTTAVALTWAWWLVHRDPAIASALRSGVGPATTPRAYVRAIVNETLRLFPPVIGSGREATSECEIAGLRVRKGDLVIFAQWIVHRNPRWFERADEFLPERWLDGLEERLHPFAYFPFGAGRRNCVGRVLATEIAALVMPAIARRWSFTPDSWRMPKLHAVITPRPRDGIPMRLFSA
jgi:cytochrome P450